MIEYSPKHVMMISKSDLDYVHSILTTGGGSGSGPTLSAPESNGPDAFTCRLVSPSVMFSSNSVIINNCDASAMLIAVYRSLEHCEDANFSPHSGQKPVSSSRLCTSHVECSWQGNTGSQYQQQQAPRGRARTHRVCRYPLQSKTAGQKEATRTLG